MNTRHLAFLIIIVILCLFQTACVGPIVKKPDGTIMVAGIVGTDADAMVVDGPLPTLIGFAPVTDRKGVVIGQRPVYGAGTSGEKALFASYGLNQSKGLGKVTAEIRNAALGFAMAEVSKAADANRVAADTEAAKLAAETEKAKLANEAARDAQKHAENMAEFEVPAEVIPAP